MARPAGRRAGSGFPLHQVHFVRAKLAPVVLGAAVLASSSTLVAAGTWTAPAGAATLSSSSTLGPTASVSHSAAAALASTSVLTSAANTQIGSAALTSTSTLVSAGTAKQIAAASLISSSALTATLAISAAAVLSSTSALTTAGVRTALAAAVLSSSSALTSAGTKSVPDAAVLLSTSYLEVQTTTALGRINLRATSTLGVFIGSIAIGPAANLSSTSTLVVVGIPGLTGQAVLYSFSSLDVAVAQLYGIANLRSTSRLSVDSGPGPAPSTALNFTFAFDLSVGTAETLSEADQGAAAATPTGTAAPESGTHFVMILSGSYRVLPARTGLRHRRAISAITLAIVTPVTINGRPFTPKYRFFSDSSMVDTQGAGHTVVIPDPDPVYHSPAGAPAITYRWLASDLELTGEYINSWPAHGAGPSWNSVFPYRPKLRRHQHYGAGANSYTYQNMVFFNHNFVEHMWLDLGAQIPQPYTWVFCGIPLAYPDGRVGHFLLDAGKSSPTTTIEVVRTDRKISDGLASRAVMLAKRDSQLICTRYRIEDGVYARTKHYWAPRPRVFAGVYNGSSSYVAAMDNHAQSINKGKVDNFKQRYFVTGRSQSHLSDNYATNMALLEIRLYRKALTPTELKAIYRQMAATYKFNLY